MKKKFLIDYTGDFSQEGKIKDPFDLTIHKITSTKINQLELCGSKQDLNSFLLEMERNCPNFKLIEINTEDRIKLIARKLDLDFYPYDHYSIEKELPFEQKAQNMAKATISQLVTLIQEHGEEKDVVRFLKTKEDFQFLIDQDAFVQYQKQNPLIK